MNRIHERSSKLRAARFATVALTLLFIAALFVPTLSAQIVAPAGSVIGNQATATYTDANSVSRQAFSNLVQTSVTQIFKGTLTQSQSKYATPGTQVLFPHTYQNTGNGPDTVTFSYPTVGSDLTNVHIYMDANGDGIPDNTTDLNNTGIGVAAGASVKVVVVATLTSGALKTDPAANFQLSLSAASTGGGTVTGTPNTDTVVFSSNGVINVTKSMSAAGVGGTSTVTLTYTNTGNATATGVIILDPLATLGYFTYKTGTLVWNGSALADTAAPATGLAWAGYGTNLPQATIASVAPGVTGTIQYQVTVGTPSAYPATFTNYAQYQYVDGGGNTIPSGSTYINTNTVSLAFGGSAAVKFTAATTGSYTAGNPAAGTPPPNTTPDTDVITTPTTYSQGATISWSQTITNKGQVTDTYNLTLDPAGAGTTLDPTIAAASQFPAGTTFQLYRADGKTPLTDSNGDGIIDSGPLASAGTTVVVVSATLPATYAVSSSTTLIVNIVATSTNATASNFSTPGLQDVIQDEVTIVSTKNAGVDVAANAADTIGNGIGTSGEAAGPYTGNPGAVIAIPFWIFNNGTNSAPDAYNLSFRYSATDVGALTPPLTPFATPGTTPPAIGTTIPAWTVQIAPNTGTSCSTYGAPVTASSVIQPASNAEYCLVLQVPASYTSGTYYFAVQAQSSGTGGIDQMAVKATVNSYPSVSISPNNQGTIYAGGTVSYKHVVTNGGNVSETVNFNTPTNSNTNGWTVAIFAADGTGGLGTLSNPVTPGTTTLSLGAGASAIYYLVVQAPAGANPGDADLTGWGITITVGTNNSTAVTVTDTTTVVSGQVKLVKSQWVDTACTHGTATFTTSNATATSGQCIMYQIVATNMGTTNATALTVADGAPPYTTYLGAFTPTVANTCSLTNPTVAALSGTAPFSYTFTGSMTPGCTATIAFEVKLN